MILTLHAVIRRLQNNSNFRDVSCKNAFHSESGMLLGKLQNAFKYKFITEAFCTKCDQIENNLLSTLREGFFCGLITKLISIAYILNHRFFPPFELVMLSFRILVETFYFLLRK